MSDPIDAIQDATTALFDFATSPIRAAGDLLFPDVQAPSIPEPQAMARPDLSGVVGRRAELRRAQASQGRRSLLFASSANRRNTGQRPRATTALGGGQ